MLTLQTLDQLLKPYNRRSIFAVENDLDISINQKIQLAIRWRRLNLPVQEIAYPQEVRTCLDQLDQLFPAISDPRRRICLDYPISALIKLSKAEKDFFHVTVSLGFKVDVPRLLVWGVRSPKLTWQDRVRCWATVKYFKMKPDDLLLVLLCLHPSEEPEKRIYQWDARQHKQTEKWIKLVVTGKKRQVPPIPKSQTIEIPDLDEIEEVVL